MFEKVLIGLTCISYVVLAGFLVFLCYRTRSKGLMFITALFIGVTFLSWIFDEALGAVLNAYMGPWEPGQDVRGVKLLRALDIVIKVNRVTSLLDTIFTSSVCFSSTKSGNRESFAISNLNHKNSNGLITCGCKAQ